MPHWPLKAMRNEYVMRFVEKTDAAMAMPDRNIALQAIISPCTALRRVHNVSVSQVINHFFNLILEHFRSNLDLILTIIGPF